VSEEFVLTGIVMGCHRSALIDSAITAEGALARSSLGASQR